MKPIKLTQANLSSIIARAKQAQLQREAQSAFHGAIAEGERIRKSIHFVPSEAMRKAADVEGAKAPQHHYVFCSHEIPYWRPCPKCRRDKSLAKRNGDIVLRAVGGVAFFTR